MYVFRVNHRSFNENFVLVKKGLILHTPARTGGYI